MERPTCRTCPYWDKNINQEGSRDSVQTGACKVKSLALNPRKTEDDWCGEHPDFKGYVEDFSNVQANIRRLEARNKAASA